MRYGLIIIIITGFLIMDTYHEGHYTQYLLSLKKYYKMAVLGFIGLSLYTFMRKHPNESSSMFGVAADLIKYMPVDSGASDILSPLLDFSNTSNNLYDLGGTTGITSQFKRMMNSGRSATGRSVSETKKKYVASQQGWKCQNCNNQLDATYEVDHKIDLQFGGSNHVSNLRALCVGCHKKKGMMQKIQ